MTISKFEEQLKKANPQLRIRQKYFHGIGGIFHRNEFIVTLSHGHVPFHTMRYIYKRGDRYNEKIKKRGRAELARILNRRGLITHQDSIKLKHGLL